jgi:hypothetical protein
VKLPLFESSFFTTVLFPFLIWKLSYKGTICAPSKGQNTVLDLVFLVPVTDINLELLHIILSFSRYSVRSSTSVGLITNISRKGKEPCFSPVRHLYYCAPNSVLYKLVLFHISASGVTWLRHAIFHQR